MDDYHRLSSVQAGQPEFAIFRLYMPLQAMQLNLLQAEIAQLRQGLGLQLELDRQSEDQNNNTRFPRLSFDRALSSGQGPQDSKQKALWDQLDATLERYSAQSPPTYLSKYPP